MEIYHFNLGTASLPFLGFVVTGTATVSRLLLLAELASSPAR